jgi:Cytochrome c oxidase subunit IIa family
MSETHLLQTPGAVGLKEPPGPKEQIPFDEQQFKPRGAVAFFVVLVALGLIIWFGIYFLMLNRI